MDYPERLRKNGFDVEEISYIEKLGQEVSTRYRLDPQEILYIAKKPVS